MDIFEDIGQREHNCVLYSINLVVIDNDMLYAPGLRVPV
jgi:hypothetical protein